MNFCAKCGRERSGDARYCGGCGTEFAADPAAAATPPSDDSGGGDAQPPASAEAQAVTPQADEPERADEPAGPVEPAGWELPTPAGDEWAPPADATRMERQPDATMIDRPGSAGPARTTTATAEPDPFAAWFAPDSQAAQAARRPEPGGQWQAAQPWQSADTVYAGSGQPPSAYPPPSQQVPAYPPPQPPYGAQPGPPPGGGRSSGGRTAALIVAVVLVMLAAGGGAYALVSRSSKHNTAQPPANPTAGSAAQPTGAASASASAPASAAASATAAPSPTSSLVRLGANVAATGAEPAVESTLSHNFQGINTHNYAEYQGAHNAAEQAAESQSAFDTGYGSTQDTGMTLVSLVSTPNGGESAKVRFTSHQDKGTGVDGSACNKWQLTYFLVPQGTGYVIGPPPAGYKPVYSDC